MQQGPPGVSRQRARFPKFTCPICDKAFVTQETLNHHLITHRLPQKSLLSFKCDLCNAQYPSKQTLEQHKMTYHRNIQAQGSEMVCPMVNLKQPGVIEKLAKFGIQHCVVLNQLDDQPNGIFGLPIVSIDSANSPAQSNSKQGPPNVCSLGPPKTIGRGTNC